MAAARRLVLRSGHAQLSLREVARRVGFSPASLYQYFDSKDDILAALGREASAHLMETLKASLRGAVFDRATLVELALAYTSWAKRNSEDYMLLFERLPSKRVSLAEPPGSGTPYWLVLDAVRRAIEAAGSKPRERGVDDVETLAYGLWATAHGMAMLQLTHLAGFESNFAANDRAVFEALVEGWGL